MKIIVLLIVLFLGGCESNLETTLREQKECKQVGGEPVTKEIAISNFRGEKLSSGFTVICRFKES